jgi:hypothetical protein
LSPYASSLLAPVCCNIAYTMTPRSAAAAGGRGGGSGNACGLSGGSAGSSRAGSVTPGQHHVSTPRTARF